MSINLLNPYSLLGVTTNSTMKDLKKAYYCLSLLCHPDKGGSTDDMVVIHKAYLYVKEQLTLANTSITYEEAEEQFEQFCKEQESQPPPFSTIYEENNDFIHDFNREFLKQSVENPFQEGYGHLMEKSIIQEDIDISEPIQHHFSREIVEYIEPHHLPDTYGDYHHFDIDKVTDFSHKIDRLILTDYQVAFSPYENLDHIEIIHQDYDQLLLEREQPGSV